MMQNETTSEIKVWDIAVRIFHWSLVASFAFAWLSAEEWDKAHEYVGYYIGGLIIFRLLWGLIGTKYARFTNFVYSPSHIINYLKSQLTHKSERYLGHNPAGGAMIIALLISLSATTVTGILMTTNKYWGSEFLEEAHEAAATLTLVLVGLHVAGVLYSSLAHNENLVRSMINGRKKR